MTDPLSSSGCDPARPGESHVAVIIPTYKPGDYLERCLRAIDAQTLDRSMFCVYIGLNGPRYPFENDIFRLLDGVTFRHEYLYLEEAGVSRCRNALLELSSEEFVVFVDDDDVVSHNYLLNLLAVSSRHFIGLANVRGFTREPSDNHDVYAGEAFAQMAETEMSKLKSRKYYSSASGIMIHRDMIGLDRFNAQLARGGRLAVHGAGFQKGVRNAKGKHEYSLPGV
jgi:glycosyltransferase involved in cell wall biosynthesis